MYGYCCFNYIFLNHYDFVLVSNSFIKVHTDYMKNNANYCSFIWSCQTVYSFQLMVQSPFRVFYIKNIFTDQAFLYTNTMTTNIPKLLFGEMYLTIQFSYVRSISFIHYRSKLCKIQCPFALVNLLGNVFNLCLKQYILMLCR